MKRIAIAVFGLVFGLFSQASQAANYQDLWWNPAQSGMGVVIGQQGGTLFVGWYFYRADGSATFLSMAAPLVGSSASGSLIRTTGDPPGPSYNPSAVQPVVVGTATLTFTSDATATLAYEYDGLSGTMALQRFTFSALPIAGTYRYSMKQTASGCTLASNNGTRYDFGTAVITATNENFTMRATSAYTGGFCNYSGAYAQNGITINLAGSVACSSGIAGNMQLSISPTDNSFQGTATEQATVGETCHVSILFGGVRQ